MHWFVYLLAKWFGMYQLDERFKQRKKQLVDGFYVVELSADMRVQFTDLATDVLAIEDEVVRARSFIAMRMQVIAAAMRNRHGVMVYDHNNPEHLLKIAALPLSQLDRLLQAACNLSALQWMLPEAADSESEVNPLKASSPAA